ncbi:MAG: large-conductance mechanosensitive channel protein MscL [Patescibacteria group bacterium]
MKKYLKEFQEFAVKGNVVDLAVAVVIGGAFGKIVSSFVADIIMPPLGLLMGGINFSDIKIVLKKAVEAANGAVVTPSVSINIGLFLQNILDFLIVAVAIFFMVKLIGRLKTRLKSIVAEGEKKAEEIKLLTKDQELLGEIRDLLKRENNKKVE